MNSNRLISLAVAALMLVAVGYWYIHSGQPPAAPFADAGPVAEVATVVLRRDRFEATLTAYGTVVAAPGEATTFSVPFESRVRKVLVTGGQVLESDTPLLEIEPSPVTRLQLDEAHSERDSATQQLTLLEQRVKLKLATRQDLLQAQLRAHDADLRLRSMEQQGVGAPLTLRSASTGLVSRIEVQTGQIVPAGAVLVETIGEHQITIRLGVESEDIALLQTGQAVRLLPVDLPDSQPVAGNIRLITRQVNPDTRLVDVYVAPEEGARLLLNEYVSGQIVIAAQDALVVARTALLPEADHYVMFTIENDHALRHSVRIGLENKMEVQVFGAGLSAGQAVVTTGNSQLQDGMAVKVESN